jgi:phosphoglycerate dehydrogenase-like enzyme
MQILMSEAAHGRVAARLATLGVDLDVTILAPNGAVVRAGTPLAEDEIVPEVVWVSLDLYPGSQLGTILGLVLRSTSVRFLQSFAAGVDNAAFRAVMAKGVRLAKSSAQAPAIAEYVLCNALAQLHPLARYAEDKAARRWRRAPFREIASTRWALVGYGNIGREIAQRLRPFGAGLTVLRRRVRPEPLADEVRPTADLIDVAASADVVVLACALNAETRGLAGEAFFQALKPGALFINIGRGGLVDEEALRRGLDRDQPGHAVLDVFEVEPLPEDAWFWAHPKLTLSPHFSGGGEGVMGRGDSLFLENLARYARGAALLNEADPSEADTSSA